VTVLSAKIEALAATKKNNPPPFLVLIDENGAIQFINSHLVNMLNLNHDNIQGTNLFSFVQEEDVARVKHTLSATENDKPLLSAGFSLKNGTVHNINWEITRLASISKFLCIGYKKPPIPMDEVSDTGFVPIIPGRENNFKTYMDSTSRFMWLMDKNKKIVYANPSLLNHFNVGLENLQQVITDSFSKTVPDIFDNNNKHTTPQSTIFRSPRADGKEHIFKVTTFPVGNNGMTGGEAEDVTATWEKEKQLREMNETLLYIMQATTEATWEWDIASGKVEHNITLLDMIGFPLESHSHINWWLSRIHPDDRKNFEDKMAEVISDQQPSWEAEYRFLCATDKYIALQDKGYVVYESGVATKMIGSVQDITEVKKLEIQLMEEKLDRQEKIAEAIIEAQEEERTKLGHELHDNVNQVLTTAKLYLEMLKPVNENDSNILGKSKAFILDAINEIRNVSKTMVLPQLKGSSLEESIRGLLEEIKVTGFYIIDFSCTGHTANSISENKKVTLYRIMQEQIKNIIKHSRAKKITVQLRFSAKEVTLTVHDNGVGFDASVQRRGIGLSNIYDRAELYKGKVELKTAPGEGCSIEVTIPL
jgi:signal transduction histidine kinase